MLQCICRLCLWEFKMLLEWIWLQMWIKSDKYFVLKWRNYQVNSSYKLIFLGNTFFQPLFTKFICLYLSLSLCPSYKPTEPLLRSNYACMCWPSPLQLPLGYPITFIEDQSLVHGGNYKTLEVTIIDMCYKCWKPRII